MALFPLLTIREVFPLVQAKSQIYAHIYRHKRKAIPLQAWTGPDGSWRLRLPDFKITGT